MKEPTGLPPGANAGERYFPALDGLRAVAILMVFFDHYAELPELGRGVSVFFVLSGFLITRVLLDARDEPHRFRTFYLRRSLRIFPVYYAVWLGIALAMPFIHIWWNRGNLLYLAYLGNYIWTFYGTPQAPWMDFVHVGFGKLSFADTDDWTHLLFVGHFWTLSVEEQFYFVWPMVIFWTRRVKSLVAICLGTILGVIVLKIAASLWQAGFPERVTKLTIMRCDEFALGGLLAVLLALGYAEALQRWAKRVLGWGLVALLASYIAVVWMHSMIAVQRWSFTGITAAVDVVSAGLILLCVSDRGWIVRCLKWRPMMLLGRISYGFYIFHDIFHGIIRGWVESHMPASPESTQDWTIAGIAFVLTLALSAASYRWLEKPFLRLKNRVAAHQPLST